MGRRRRDDDNLDSAFELFLDAISNGFGSVLFIGILVAILLQVADLSRRQSDAVAGVPSPSAASNEAAAVILREIEQLRLRQAVLREQGEQNIAPSDDAAGKALREKMQAQEADLVQRARRQLSLEEQLAQVEVDIQRARGRAEALGRQVREVRDVLQVRQQTASQNLRLPLARPTVKQQVPVLVHDGRLTFAYRYDGAGRPVGRSADVQWGSGGESLAPMRGAGTVVKGDTDGAGVEDAFDRFDPSRMYVELVVWPDSYEEAAPVRDHLISRSFGFGLTLMHEDEALGVATMERRVQ